MLQRKKLTGLIITAIAVKMLLTYPRNIVLNSGNAAWLQILYTFLITVLVFLVTAAAYRGRKNVIETAELCGGKFLKVVMGIIVFAILTANIFSTIRIFPETIKTILLQETRVEVILLVFAVVTIIGAYMGLESIATVNYLFLPIAGAVMIAFLALLLPYYRLGNLVPILGNGAKSVFVTGINSMSVFSDIILLNIYLPYMDNYGDYKKGGIKAILIGGVVAVLITLAYCSAYPYPDSKNFIFPVYQLTRMIHLSSFFSRFETFFQFIWSILVLLYAAFYVYSMCYVWQITFNLKYSKPLIVPITIALFTAALLPNSIMDFINSESMIYYIIYPFAFLLPLIFAAPSRKLTTGGKNEKT